MFRRILERRGVREFWGTEKNAKASVRFDVRSGKRVAVTLGPEAIATPLPNFEGMKRALVLTHSKAHQIIGKLPC